MKAPLTRVDVRALVVPERLSPEQAEVWRSYVDLAAAAGTLRPEHGPLLEHLAISECVVRQCDRALAAKDGLTFLQTDPDGNPRGISAWPEIAIRRAALADVRRLLADIGLTKASAVVDPFAGQGAGA